MIGPSHRRETVSHAGGRTATFLHGDPAPQELLLAGGNRMLQLSPREVPWRITDAAGHVLFHFALPEDSPPHTRLDALALPVEQGQAARLLTLSGRLLSLVEDLIHRYCRTAEDCGTCADLLGDLGQRVPAL